MARSRKPKGRPGSSGAAGSTPESESTNSSVTDDTTAGPPPEEAGVIPGTRAGEADPQDDDDGPLVPSEAADYERDEAETAAEPASGPEGDTIPGATDETLAHGNKADEDALADAETRADGATTARPAPPPAPVKVQKVGFLPLFLGGVTAAGIGFAAAQYMGPEAWPFGGEDPQRAEAEAQLRQDVDALRQELSAAANQNTTLRSDLEALTARLQESEAPLQERLEMLRSGLDDAGGRLSAIEQRPINDTSAEVQAALSGINDGIEALRQDLDNRLQELRAEVESSSGEQATLGERLTTLEQEVTGRLDTVETTLSDRIATLEQDLERRLQEASSLEEDASAAEARARQQKALAELRAALTAGTPFDAVLADLAAEADVAAPQALSAYAADGIPTLASLQESFPEAARNALNASIKADSGSDPVSRFGAFLRTQTGARSLKAREGDDADAVLSRAEDALRQGRLDETLEILRALPDAGRAEMTSWLEAANRRAAAVAAFDGYATSLTQN